MSKDTLYELVDRVDEADVEMVYFLLSRIIDGAKEAAPLPDEKVAIDEYERDKKNGTLVLYSSDEVWGK